MKSKVSEVPIQILFLGDVVGDPGIAIVANWLPQRLSTHQYDLVIANGENASHGRGITIKQVKELLKAGVQVITGGNHIFDREKVVDAFNAYPEILLRPANYPPEVMGKGSTIFETTSGYKIGVINLQGRAFMIPIENPFSVGESIIGEMTKITPIILIDFHAEATAEKLAFARFIDGRVSAIIGTHTHVQTNDAEVLPGGTAYICDVGMTGSHGGVIGMETQAAIYRARMGVAPPSAPAVGDDRIHAVEISIDETSGKAISILPIRWSETQR